MSNQHVEFLNPENLPVEQVTLSVSNSGVIRHIKALDPYWVDKRELIMYERPPSGSSIISGAIDAWKSKMDIFLANLKWLLGLEHHKFWSTILHHKHCVDMLVSFLQEADPPYIPPHENRDVQKLYEEIRRLVLVVLSRLVTNKESKSRWMSKEYMGELLYNNFVFTIPVIWDTCLAYGADNLRHVSRLLDAVFALQPRYERDAEYALGFVNEAFKYIILQVNNDYDSEEPPNLPETFKGFGEIHRPTDSKGPETITFNVLRDLVIHLLDTAMTLRIFVEAYPKSAHILKKKNFILSVAQLYEHGIPHLYEKLEEIGDESSAAYSEVERYLDMARAEFIDLFREVLAVYKNCIFNGEGSVSSHVEAALALVLEALAERLFVRDVHAAAPLHDDLELLRQAYPDIDTVKTDFILQAIYSNIDEPVPEDLLASNTEVLTNGHVETIDHEPGPSRDIEIPDNIREESLISEVKDILPHLGDGFILKCLQHYGFNSERVINSLLEGTLAESLKGLDQNMPIIPEDPLDQKFLETGVERLNVFDGDQFDIMTRDDVDLSRIHVGKKRSKYKDLSAMLDDKTAVKSRLDIYSKYNLVCDEERMYSDEYDDTYDSDGVAPAADSEEPRRPLVTPRALLNARKEQESSEEEAPEQPEEEKPSSSKNKMDFCVNPEEMRARREAHMQARRGKPGYRPPPRSDDVVGGPRGQGQTAAVLAGRERKERHKAARGNHARRRGAQWKRSQGMMPS
ncbi:activating signal cointegrator 1 complex subunit 2 [Epargyreus clarus]|uniref:activating signal cointegrator 1 complex subunit 2 n=1 Tax=Epargyreus clarus TaxID=520877 RepID=UPI003C2FA078